MMNYREFEESLKERSIDELLQMVTILKAAFYDRGAAYAFRLAVDR